MSEACASLTQAGGYSSPAPSCGSSVASTFESRFMLVAWISARRCLGCPSVFDLAIPEDAFEGDELAFLERPGELGQALPGIDAMPFGAGLVLALVVAPALLRGDGEDDVLAVVLGGFGFCVLSEAADEDDFVEHGVIGSVSSGLSAVCGTCLPEGCAVPSPPKASGVDLRKGTRACLGAGVRTSQRRAADSGKESVRPKGGDVPGAAR